MTCSKKFDRLLQAACLGLLGVLTAAGCGGSSSSPDARIIGGPEGGPPPPSDAAVGGAVLTVTPASVDLGAVDVGTTSTPATATVTNSGKATSGALVLSVTSVPGSGILATGCSGTLAVGASCTISITAKPVTAGPISGSVSIAEGTNAPKLIAVSGIATIEGQFTLTPNSLDLGKVLLKGTATGTIVMTNIAVTGLTGIVITANGTGFALATTGTCTDTLALGQTCNIVVGFTAATAGPASGNVIVSQGGVTKSVPLAATVQAPAKLAMTPPSAALTAQLPASSAPATFYVTNSGDVPSGIPTVALGGANAADFSIASNSCVTALAGGATASCQVAVVFSPKVAAAANEAATLTVTDSGAGASSVVATLSGTAVPPSTLALSGGPDLGTVVVGAAGAPVTFTLTNNGGNNSGAISLATSDPEFVLSSTGDLCTGKDLVKGGTCTFALQFKPAAGAAGVVSARVQAAGASTANPAVLGITGTAVPAANLVANPTTLNFGAVITSQESAPLTLTITNSGGTPTGALTVSNTGAQFKIKGDTCSASPLAANKTCTITMTFTAGADETLGFVDTGTVSVTDGKTTASASLTGTGMPPSNLTMTPSVICPQYYQDDPVCYQTAVNGNPTTFQNKAVGHVTPQTISIKVTNNTPPTAAPDSGALTFAITGTAAADFAIVANNCTAAPLVSTTSGTSCILTISATPGAVGLRTALLTLTSSRGGTSQTTLEAKGLAPIEVQPIMVTKTMTGLNFGNVPLGHQGVSTDTPNPYDSLMYRVWVRDTTQADHNSTINVTLPTATPADFVWPATQVTLPINDVVNPTINPLVTPAIGGVVVGTETETGGGAGTNPCSSATISLPLNAAGTGTLQGGAATQGSYKLDTASGYWYCDFPVEFFPQSAMGPLSATLTATGSGSATPSTLTLTGTAVGQLVVTPAPALLSSPVAVGLGSATNLTLTIRNEGTTAQTNLSFALSGTGAADMQILGTTCWGVGVPMESAAAGPVVTPPLDALQPGDFCLVWVGFQPSTQSAYSVTFTATAANGPGTADDVIGTTTLQATGAQTFGAITITPDPGTFADTAFLNAAATPVTFTVKNNGTLDTGPLTFSVNSTDFTVLTATGVPGACKDSGTNTGTVPGGGSCTIQIRATPQSAPNGVGKKLISGVLSASATPGGSVNVPLTYYETSNLMVNGAAIASFSFPAQGVGTIVEQSFTLSNSGSQPVSLTFTPPSAGYFSVDQTATATPAACTAGGSTLAAGGTCTLVVKNSNTSAGLFGIPTPLVLTVGDSANAGNSAEVLLSAVTLATSQLVVAPSLGTGNSPTAFNPSTPSTGRIDLGAVPFVQGHGGTVTVWFQNIGQVPTQPLQFRWDSRTTAAGTATPGVGNTLDGEFTLTSLYPENPQACLSGTAQGGQKVPPLGLCSVSFYFAPVAANGAGPRYRDLVVVDINTTPEVYVQAAALAAQSVFVSEVTAATNEGFFQFTSKTAVGAAVAASESHTFALTNGTASGIALAALPATVGPFAISTTAAGLVNPCAASASFTGSCQFAATFLPTTTSPAFPWTSFSPYAGATLGLMGRTQQPVGLEIMRAAGVPNVTSVPASVDFGSVAVGGTTTQALTVVNTGDVAMASAAALVTAEVAVNPGATFTDDGGCTGKVLNPFGTTGDRCVVTVKATGTALTTTTPAQATFEVGTGTPTGSPATTYTLQAEVLNAANLVVSPTGTFTDTFAPTAVTGYTQQTFTIYNGVNDPTNLTYQTSGIVAVTITGASPSQFRLVGTTCPPNVGLASGAGCTITVWFAPTALSPDGNAITASLNVTGSATTNSQTILGMPKSALSISPVDNAAAATLQSTITTPLQKFVVTKDNTASPTAALDTSITGTTFVVVDDECYGKVLSGTGAGATCNIWVKYVGPTITTASTATLTVNGGTPGQSVATLVSYTGAAATSH